MKYKSGTTFLRITITNLFDCFIDWIKTILADTKISSD